MSVINFFDFSLSVLISSVLDCHSAIRVLLLDCRMRYAWFSVVDIAAEGFRNFFPVRFGGLGIFLPLDQVDLVVHFANSASG